MEDPDGVESRLKKTKINLEQSIKYTEEELEQLILFQPDSEEEPIKDRILKSNVLLGDPLFRIVSFLPFEDVFVLTQTSRLIDLYFKAFHVWKNYTYSRLSKKDIQKYRKCIQDAGLREVNYKRFLWAFYNKEGRATNINFYNNDENNGLMYTTKFNVKSNAIEPELNITTTQPTYHAQFMDIYHYLQLYKLKNPIVISHITFSKLIKINNFDTEIKFVVLYLCLKQPETYVKAVSEQKYGKLAFLREEINDFYI